MLQNNQWHFPIDGDFPEDGSHILFVHNNIYEAIYYPEPHITDKMDAWMYIPELPNKVIDVDKI